MRVLVNGLAAAGPITGIGHYTTQLLRCLHEQTAPEEIHAFPNYWLCQARSVWAAPPFAARTPQRPAPLS